jgi:hypothetical protein
MFIWFLLSVYLTLKFQAEKLIREMENKCNEKLLENKRESERCLARLKEEHGAVVGRTNSVSQ